MSIDEIVKSTPTPGFVKKNQNSDENPEQSEALPDTHLASTVSSANSLEQPKELGGRSGPDPTRYGDWEKNGRCIDF